MDIDFGAIASDLYGDKPDTGVDKASEIEVDDSAVADQYSTQIVPSNESDVVRLADETGIPDVDFVRDNYEALNYTNHRRNLRESIEDKPVTKRIFDNVIDESWAADDYKQLGVFEGVIRDVKQGWSQGNAINDIGNAGVEQMWSPVPLDQYDNSVASIRQQLGTGRTGDLGWATGMAGSVTETLPMLAGMVPEVAAGTVGGGAIGAAAGSVIPGAGTLAGAATGAGWGARAGMTYAMGKLEAGAAYDEYIQMSDDSGKRMSHDAAKGAAVIVGAVNGMIELVSIERLVRTIPGAEKFLGNITSKKMKALLGHPSMQGAVANFGARMTSASLGEGAFEALQEVVTLGGELMAAELDDGAYDEQSPTLGDAADVAGSAFFQGSQVGFAFGLPGNTVGAIYEAKAAEKVKTDQKAFEVLNDTAKEFTSLKDHPAKIKKAVAEMQDLYGSTDAVHIEPEALHKFFQEAGVNPDQIKAEMPDTWAQMIEAQKTGGNIEVPLGDYITFIAPSQNAASLANDIKFNADDYTVNELEEVKAEVEKVQAEAVDPEPISDIFPKIYEQLVEAGESKEAAAQMASLWESTFDDGLGSRLPMSSQEFFNQFEIKIQQEKESTEGLTTYQQDVPDTPAYEQALAKFGEEGMTTEARMARAKEQGFDVETTWYHGATADIPAFKEGTSETAKLGAGIYVTPKAKFAGLASKLRQTLSGGEPSVYSLYVKNENPLAIKKDDTRIGGTWNTEELKALGYTGVQLVDEHGSVIEQTVFDPANIRSVNASFDPDMADSANILYQTEKSAYATAQDMVEHNNLTLQDFVGKKVQFIFADLTAAGSVFRGIDGVEVDPIPLLGGPGFPLQKVYSDAGVAWVFRGKGKASNVVNKAEKGADTVVVLAMDQGAHRSNSTVSRAMVETFDAAQKAGKISVSDMDIITGEIQAVKALPRLAEFPGLHDSAAAHKFLDSLTFEERAGVANVLESKRVQKIEGVPNLTRMLNALRDVGYAGVNIGDALMALEINKGNPRVEFADEGIPLHPDYSMGLRGKALGKFVQPISWEILLADEMASRGKPINAFNVDRIGPVVEITQAMADKAALVEGLQTPMAAAASMAAALAGNWSDTSVAVNAGGLSPKSVEDAIKTSTAHSTLTKYTASEIKKGAKDGSLKFYKLGSSEAYVGIQRGGYKEDLASYGFESEEISDSEVAMVGVINNTQGAKGLGPAQVLKAIEEGVTALDAYSVPSVKYPDGFLPEFYSTFGFEKVGEIPFNEEYLNDDLLAFWRENKWDESKGYPPIAVMKYRGDDSARSTATIDFIREAADSRRESDINPRAEESVEALPVAQAEGEGGGADNGSRTAGSDRDSTDRFTSRLVTAASELSGLTPEIASSYGISNTDLTSIRQRFGQTLFQAQKVFDVDKPQGYIQFNDLRNYFAITLTGKANLSTFLHESGHAFLEFMHVAADIEGADPSIRTDLDTLYDWLGVAPGQALTRDHHEMMARGFETYLMEGKAPNSKVATAFERFKGWLVRIYPRLTPLMEHGYNALTDEVRGVMDRLVGVEQGFEQLRGEYKPTFESAEMAGMTEAQYDKYLGSFDKYMGEAQNKVEREVINDVLRQRTNEYRERKKELSAEVAEELDTEQVYRVRRFLSGQWGRDNPNFAHFPDYIFGQKLDTQSVKDMMGSVPPKLRSMVEPDSALTPDELAPLFGYKSGMAMLEELDSTPARGDAIFNRVDSKLEEEFGDIIKDGKLEQESLDAIHTGNMSDFIVSELKNIGQKAGNPSQNQARIAKHVARERVLSVPILSLNRSKYLSAEKRSEKASAEAVKEGKWLMAAEHKMQQLVAHYMYKEAAVAQKQADAHRKALAKYTKAPRQKALGKAGEYYLDAINALLDGVELSSRSGKALQRRTNLREFMEQQAESGIDVSIPQELQDTAKLKNYKQMSLSELTSLRDTIDHIAATARLKNMIKTKQGRQKLNDAVDKMVELMQENAPGAKNEVDARDINKRSLPQWMAASLVKPEFVIKWIDGETAGFAHSVLFNPLADAQHLENDMLEKMAGLIKPLMDQLDSKRMNETSTIVGETKTREQVFAIALNMGNRGNLKKLLAGRGWDEATLIQDIQKALTAEDFNIVQGIWDAVDTLYPEMKRVSMDAGMGKPPKVEASELYLDQLDLTLVGGYYPIVYDPRHAETLSYQQTIQIADSIFENNLFNGGVSSGFKEARVEIKKPPPLLLSLNVLSNHVGEVVHFITHYEAVKQAEKVITNPRFQKQFKDSFGADYHKAMKDWLKGVANQGAVNTDTTPLTWGSQYLRIGMSMVAMGFSFSTMIMQGFGTFTTVDEIGLSYTLKGLKKALDPTIYKDVIEMSGEIRHITKNMDREIADTISAEFGKGKLSKTMMGVKKFAFMHIAYAQRVVNVAAFEGARQQALDDGKSHTESMAYADSVVRLTQSGAGFKDLARIQGGGEIQKLFTPFYTYFSVLYGRYHDAAREVGADPMSWGKFSQRMMWLMFLPVYTEILMKGQEPDDDEDWLAWFAAKNLEYAATTLPFIRTFIALGVSDYKVQPVAAMGIFDNMARAKSTLVKLWSDDYAIEDLTLSEQRNIVKVIATMGHLPTKTPWRLYEAMVDDDVEDPIRHVLLGAGKSN